MPCPPLCTPLSCEMPPVEKHWHIHHLKTGGRTFTLKINTVLRLQGSINWRWDAEVLICSSLVQIQPRTIRTKTYYHLVAVWGTYVKWVLVVSVQYNGQMSTNCKTTIAVGTSQIPCCQPWNRGPGLNELEVYTTLSPPWDWCWRSVPCGCTCCACSLKR